MAAQRCPAWLCQGGDSRSEIGCLCIQPAQQHSPLTTGNPWPLGLSAAGWPGDVPRVSALRAFVLCVLEIPSQRGFPQKSSPMVSDTSSQCCCPSSLWGPHGSPSGCCGRCLVVLPAEHPSHGAVGVSAFHVHVPGCV